MKIQHNTPSRFRRRKPAGTDPDQDRAESNLSVAVHGRPTDFGRTVMKDTTALKRAESNEVKAQQAKERRGRNTLIDIKNDPKDLHDIRLQEKLERERKARLRIKNQRNRR